MLPKDYYENSIEEARARMDQGTYRLIERTKQNWFWAGYLFGVGTMALVWWFTRSN